MPDPANPNDQPNGGPQGVAAPLPGGFKTVNDWLTGFSAIIGTLGAVAASAAALFSNFARDEAKGAKGAANQAQVSAQAAEESARLAAMREKNEEASHKFAETISKQFQDLTEASKERSDLVAHLPELRLAVLDSVAQASSDLDPQARALRQRAFSARVALYMGDAVMLASIDPRLEVLRAWKTTALESDSWRLWLTALRALRLRATEAEEDGDSELVQRALAQIAIVQERFVNEDTHLKNIARSRADSSAIDAPLPTVRPAATPPPPGPSTRRNRNRAAARPTNPPRPNSPASLTSPTANPTPPTASDAEDNFAVPPDQLPFYDAYREALNEQLKLFVFLIGKNWPHPERLELREDPRYPGIARLFQSVDSLKLLEKRRGLSLKSVVQATDAPSVSASATASLLQQAAPPPTAPETSAPPRPLDNAQIDRLILLLANPVDTLRREARAELALLGPGVVPALVSQIELRAGKNDEEDYKTRLGVAGALVRMRQPVPLTAEQLTQIVTLLAVNDSETRALTVDFLINLEDAPTLERALTILTKIVDQALQEDFKEPTRGDTDYATKKAQYEAKGRLIVNAATVVAAYCTALKVTALGTDKKPLKATALETATRWLKEYDDKKRLDWPKLEARLQDMIKRANTPTLPLP